MTERLHPNHRFDTLVVGAANRLAVTAARTVAESPGRAYNPLFVYASPGLGKTHLLMAIGHAAAAITPGLRVVYLTLDEFVEAFHAALAAGQGEAYRKSFLETDLVLLDDVQFLTHQRELQAELLRLTDALLTAGGQLVLTSDRPPAEIAALDERLIRRFAGGLVIDIADPDYETRVAILRRKAEDRGVSFAPEVLEAAASAGERSSVRELVGALNRLIAYQAVREAPLRPAEVPEALAGVMGGAAEPPAAEPAPSPLAVASARVGRDEFGEFLSEVAATVAHQVEAWRSRVAEAILRWEGDGYRVHRLTGLLEGEMARNPEEALRAYERDVEHLRALEAEAGALSSELAGSPAFRDPDDIPAAEDLVRRTREGANPPPAPVAAWRLEDLVEASGNRMALRAARAALEQPGTKYNPLVVVGGSGTGKTHLLHAFGNGLVAAGLSPVACLSAHDFTAELIEAIERDRVAAWRARYRRVAAFLLDDIHLVGGRDRTQEELFLLFNALHEDGRQMAFTSAVPLHDLTEVERRLVTRLEGGLVVELPPPEREVRLAVAERVLAEPAGEAAGPLAQYLASRPADSMRGLQGLVQRVLHAAEAKETRPTVALARQELEGVLPRPPRSSGVRRSGVVLATAGGVRSREKAIWQWPDLADRFLEEWR